MAKDSTKAATYTFADAPEVDELPTAQRGPRGRKANEFDQRLQDALERAKPDPKHPGYFLGRGVYAKDEEQVALASRKIHSSAAYLKVSTMVRRGTADENGIPVHFSVNPERQTRD
jgi:hypothetical protein